MSDTPSNRHPSVRNSTYDWVRLFATVAVVLGHSAYLEIATVNGGIQYVLPDNVSPVYFNSALLNCLRSLAGDVYTFHMPLFFMLSGAVFALAPLPSLDACVKKKVPRLVFPYFIYGWLFMLPVKFLGGFYDRPGLKAALPEFLLGGEAGHLWFLPALFWCMLGFLVILKTLNKLRIFSIYAPLFLCAIPYVLNFQLPAVPFLVQSGLNYLFWFAFGYVFEAERRSRKAWGWKGLVIALIATLLLQYVSKRYWLLPSFFKILTGSFGVYLLARLCSIGFPNMPQNRIWKVLIRNTFYIYLFHDPLEYLVLRIFFHFNLLTSGIGCYLYVFSRTVLVFAVSLLLGEAVRYTKKTAVPFLMKKMRIQASV